MIPLGERRHAGVARPLAQQGTNRVSSRRGDGVSALPFYDITVPVHEGMAVWPGDPQPERHPVLSMDAGDSCNVSAFVLGAHTGTHVDAPLHFLSGGGSVDGIELDVLVGPAQVVEVPGDGHVTEADLDAADICPETERVLLRTSNSRRRLLRSDAFDRGFQAIEESGARWLVAHGVRLIGVDYLSVEPFDMEGAQVHNMLLQAGMVILEGCDLSDMVAGDYVLVCAPMRWLGAEGAPARAFLVANELTWPGLCT